MNVLYVNTAVRDRSRTKALAEHFLGKLGGDVTEVRPNELGLANVGEDFLKKRDKACMSGDFSDKEFSAAKQFAQADVIVISAPLWDLSFPAALKRVEAFLSPGRAQLVLLSGYGVENAESLPEEIRAEKSAWCADAYVLTRPAAQLILKANDPVITVADSFKRWRRRHGLELYRALPATARQDDVRFGSENQVLAKSGWLVRNLMWLADWAIWKVTGR